MAVTVFEPTYRMTSLDMTLLKIISKGNTEGFDGELVDWVKAWRCQHMNPAKAFLLNLIGPDLRAVRASVAALTAQGFIIHELESQDRADGHGLVNYIGLAPRKRLYRLTNAGRAAVELAE